MIRNRRTRATTVALLFLLAAIHAQTTQTNTPVADLDLPPQASSNTEILSDTKGVDFKPYLSKQIQRVRKNWHDLIPEEAMRPELASGRTSI